MAEQTEILTAHEGEWAVYQRNYTSMSLAKKMEYFDELGLLIQGFDKARKARWTWLAWILAAPVFISLFMYRSATVPFMAEFVLRFFFGSLLLFLMLLITRRSFVVKKPSGVACLLGVLALAGTTMLQPIYQWRDFYSLFLFLWALATLAVFFYISLAGQGFGKLKAYAVAEQAAVEESVRESIFDAPLEPIKLRCRVALEAGEQAYMESAAILIDAKNKNQYQVLFQTLGGGIMQQVQQLTGTLFGPSSKLQSNLNAAWEAFLSSSGKAGGAPQGYQKKLTRKKLAMEEVGSFILTDRRVLFVTSKNGFQIRLPDITAFYTQENPLPTFTVESRSGLRTLQTDNARFLSMMLDRLCRKGCH